MRPAANAAIGVILAKCALIVPSKTMLIALNAVNVSMEAPTA